MPKQNQAEPDATALGNNNMETVQKKIDEMLKAAEKKAKEIVASAEQAIQATAKEEKILPEEIQEREEYLRQPVTVKLFKDNKNYKDDVFVAVNGKAFQIKRGIEVSVPRYVKEVLDNSITQDEAAAAFIESKEREFEQESKKFQ